MMSTPSASSTRRRKLFLVGSVKHAITGSKLPSIGDVLNVLFYNLRYRRLDLNASAALLAEEILLYWKKARIPTRNPDKVRQKIKDLHKSWQNLQKNATKSSQIHREREEAFKNTFDNLFDIAAMNAMQMMKIEEDREFLIQQRKKGREGCMIGVDRNLVAREARKRDREAKEEERRKQLSNIANTSGNQAAECGDSGE